MLDIGKLVQEISRTPNLNLRLKFQDLTVNGALTKKMEFQCVQKVFTLQIQWLTLTDFAQF
jgi:hypothetical protein